MSLIHGYTTYMEWEQKQLMAPWFSATVTSLFPNMNHTLCADPARQKNGVDLVLRHKHEDQVPPWDRREYTLDAKFRRKTYPDFIVEIRHSGPTVAMLGWGLRGLTVDYLLYVQLATAEAVLIKWESWWRWWLRERNQMANRYPMQRAENRSYTTYFAAIPWHEFEADVPMVRTTLVGYTERVPG